MKNGDQESNLVELNIDVQLNLSAEITSGEFLLHLVEFNELNSR